MLFGRDDNGWHRYTSESELKGDDVIYGISLDYTCTSITTPPGLGPSPVLLAYTATGNLMPFVIANTRDPQPSFIKAASVNQVPTAPPQPRGPIPSRSAPGSASSQDKPLPSSSPPTTASASNRPLTFTFPASSSSSTATRPPSAALASNRPLSFAFSSPTSRPAALPTTNPANLSTSASHAPTSSQTPSLQIMPIPSTSVSNPNRVPDANQTLQFLTRANEKEASNPTPALSSIEKRVEELVWGFTYTVKQIGLLSAHLKVAIVSPFTINVLRQ